MKKYVYLWGLCSVGIQPMAALQGPVSHYAPPPFYQNSPASTLTQNQQYHVGRAFENIKAAFKVTHSRCQSRKDCLKQDLAVLQNFFVDHPTHPANPFLHDLNNAILHDSAHHIFTTQWVVFQKLSPQRQKEYRDGLRVFPLQKKMVQTHQGMQQATYNQDDVLTRLLEELAHHHKNCQGYTGCLTRDLNIIANLQNRLADHDPVRNTLRDVYNNVQYLASREIFNTTLYLNLYNPLRSNWSEVLQKHQSKKSVGYGRKEWQAIKRSSRASRWVLARITNDQPTKRVSQPQQSQHPQNQTQSQNQGNKPLLQIWNKIGQSLLGKD
jgi:hypothetical protein